MERSRVVGNKKELGISDCPSVLEWAVLASAPCVCGWWCCLVLCFVS